MEIARYWRLNNQRYNMTGSVCTQCGKPYFSPRPICDACQNDSAASAKRSQQVPAPLAEPAHR